MKELMRPIDSDLPLAKAFNKIISKVQTLRIITMPRTFEDVKGKDAAFRMTNYYQTVLWEKWLHGVVERLQEWVDIIDEYFDEFEGSWKYYALSKRIKSIKEYGSDDEEDFNIDGSIKTTGISREQLHYYTVFQDLYHDCVDIVQDSHPEDLLPLIEAIDIKSRISITDILSKMSGKTVPSYFVGDDGVLHEATFAEKELRKATGMVEAHDFGHLVYAVAILMEQLTKEIEAIAKSDGVYDDQHDLLYAIQNDADAILNLQITETRFFKEKGNGKMNRE